MLQKRPSRARTARPCRCCKGVALFRDLAPRARPAESSDEEVRASDVSDDDDLMASGDEGVVGEEGDGGPSDIVGWREPESDAGGSEDEPMPAEVRNRGRAMRGEHIRRHGATVMACPTLHLSMPHTLFLLITRTDHSIAS